MFVTLFYIFCHIQSGSMKWKMRSCDLKSKMLEYKKAPVPCIVYSVYYRWGCVLYSLSLIADTLYITIETREKFFPSCTLGLIHPAFEVGYNFLLWWILVKFSTKLTVSLQYQMRNIHGSNLFLLGWSRSKISPFHVCFRTYVPDKHFSTKKMRQKGHHLLIPGRCIWRILHINYD